MKNLDLNTLMSEVNHKNIVITGGSSGIGETTAYLLSKAGAHVILIARSSDKLDDVKHNILQASGKVSVYSCDLTDNNAVDKVAQTIVSQHKHIDLLINNAGRSIRRSAEESLDRFHDFERTMRINYFGALKLTLAVLPNMLERQSGHIINISSIAVLANSPRFSAYVASKAALDAFSRCLAAEVKSKNIKISTVYMPLVRTPMTAPTKLYKYMPLLSTDEAAQMVIDAVINKPPSIACKMGKFASATYSLVPTFNLGVQSIGYRIFPSSKSAQNSKSKLNLLQKAFTKILPGEPH